MELSAQTLEMLKVAYGEWTVSQKSVYKWYKLFTDGREEETTLALDGPARQQPMKTMKQ